MHSLTAFLETDLKIKAISCFETKSGTSNPNRLSKTFRLCINANDKPALLNPDSWADGIVIKSWRFMNHATRPAPGSVLGDAMDSMDDADARQSSSPSLRSTVLPAAEAGCAVAGLPAHRFRGLHRRRLDLILRGLVTITSIMTMASNQPLSLLTFNMHGFKQGEPFLSDACLSNNYDLICVQEHWLGSDNLNKLSCINDNYISFGESAMINSNASGILYGRPYGGVATLINKNLVSGCKCLHTSERLVALSIFNSMFINTYLPCDDRSQTAADDVTEILAVISDLLSDFSYDSIFLCGDLNTDLNRDRGNATLIKNLLYECNMFFLNIVDDDQKLCHTFSNVKRNCSSQIDYICLSNDLSNYVHSYKTVDAFNNLSDHEPVCMLLSLPVSTRLGKALLSSRTSINECTSECKPAGDGLRNSEQSLPCSNDDNVVPNLSFNTQLRFDHGDKAGYYEYTRITFQPILDQLNDIWNRINNLYGVDGCVFNYFYSVIDSVYISIVLTLNDAANNFIPRVKCGFFKPWWDNELEDLKQKAMHSHSNWVASGRPRSGSIFNKRSVFFCS